MLLKPSKALRVNVGSEGTPSLNTIIPDVSAANGGNATEAAVEAQFHVTGHRLVSWTATASQPIFVAPYGGCTIQVIYLSSDTATTGSDGSNKHGIQVTNMGVAGAGTATLRAAALTTSGNEIGAYTAWPFSVTQNAAMLEGESLKFTATVTGIPTALTNAVIMCEVHFTQPI